MLASYLAAVAVEVAVVILSLFPTALHANVSVSLASRCFHQSRVLWHETAGPRWLTAEKSNTYLLGRARQRRAVAMMTLLGFPEGHTHTHTLRKRYGATGPWVSTVWERQETGNYPPFHFPIGWNGVQKNWCFFLRGNKLMQSRCGEGQGEGQRSCLAQELAALCLSATLRPPF